MTAMSTATAPEQLPVDIVGVEERGWSVVRARGWVQCSPPGATLPPAGWKVHVSAGAADVAHVLGALRDVAVGHGLVFKFLPSERDIRRSTSKGTLRSVSGKLGCLYATDEETLERVVTELRRRLRGVDGPDILTDLRCGAEPVFIRYGAFEEVWTFRDGQRRLGLRDPDGHVVVDEGRARWTLPPWVTLPHWADRHLEERRARRTNLPCVLRRALHFSNAGGVYEGAMRDTGETVLVKEGRPFIALDGDGVDAASRLEVEYRRLLALQDTGVVPRAVGFYRGTRHAYLVREMLTGETVAQRHFARWPWCHAAAPARDALDAHEAWALATLDEAAAIVERVHRKGMLVHDLHAGNFFVSQPDNRLKLFDLETLTDLTRPGLPPLIVPDYLAPADVEGVDRDDYAHRVLGHALLSPSVAGWADPGRRAWVRRWIHDHFGAETLARLDAHTRGDAEPIAEGDPARLLAGGLDERARTGGVRLAGADDPSLGRGLAGAVLALAAHPACGVPQALTCRLRDALPDLSRRDPCLSTGSAGVVLALAVAGADFDREAWADATAHHLETREAEPHLWHGLAGIALAWGVLRASGWDGAILREVLLPRLEAIEPGRAGGPGLLTGDAGVSLAWSVLARSGVADAAERARAFLAAPRADAGPLEGGLEGVGGWLLALAAGPATDLDAAAEGALALVSGGLRHRDGGLIRGLGGTLLGLAALERRRPATFGPARARWARQLSAWVAAGGTALHDVHAGRAADDLENGTAGPVLAEALLTAGRHAR